MEDEVLTPEEYELILSGGTANASLKRAMELQQRQAEALRAGAPEGQMVSGRYVAPHLMQYVGNAAKEFMSQRALQQAQKSGQGIDESQGRQNALILKALLRNRQVGMGQPQIPTQQPMPQPPTPWSGVQ